MDEMPRREFRWYVQGCLDLGLEPKLERSLFLVHYDRYQRLSQAMQRYEERRRRRVGRHRGSLYQDDVFLERLMGAIRAEQEKLKPLTTAVGIGQRIDNDDMSDGGAGMPAYRRPDPPVLVGAGAKMLPHLDPDPPFRDP